MASAKGSLRGSQKLDESLGQTSSGKPAYNTGPSVEYDTDQEQQLPMMPQLPPDVLRAQQQQAAQPQFLNMASDNPAPTGMRAWAGFGCAIFALACLCVAFASPYWMQTYPNSMNAFRNMGLWEICMDNYMHHKDDSQTIYNGCWWVFDRAAKYYKLREWLLAPWFIGVQVMAVGSLIMMLISVFTVAMVFLHFCPILNHEYYQTYAMFAASAMQFLITMMVFISSVMFGYMSQDWEWMPRPDRNFISWGFGFYIICGMATIASGALLFLEALRVYNELMYRDDEYNKAMLEMSGYGPSVSSYPPGGSYPPGYDSSYSGQPQYPQQYQQQPSFEKGAYDKSYDSQQRPY